MQQVLTDQERSAALDVALSGDLANGARVESKLTSQAVIVRGGKVNHILHLILTVLTAGLWVVVWLFLILTGGEKRQIVSVDSYGNVSRRNA